MRIHGWKRHKTKEIHNDAMTCQGIRKGGYIRDDSSFVKQVLEWIGVNKRHPI